MVRIWPKARVSAQNGTPFCVVAKVSKKYVKFVKNRQYSPNVSTLISAGIHAAYQPHLRSGCASGFQPQNSSKTASKCIEMLLNSVKVTIKSRFLAGRSRRQVLTRFELILVGKYRESVAKMNENRRNVNKTSEIDYFGRFQRTSGRSTRGVA